jgi:putative acetyltransferase
MWTAPGHRGRGLARRVLAALEHEAQQLGYRVLQLQTGAMATSALALYESSGYRRIAPFGRYRDEPLAVGFEKRLTGASADVYARIAS